MNVRKLRQANTGITLISLIVTIVILLILAGITINLVFSDNGIIKNAQEKLVATDGKTNENIRLDLGKQETLIERTKGTNTEYWLALR